MAKEQEWASPISQMLFNPLFALYSLTSYWPRATVCRSWLLQLAGANCEIFRKLVSYTFYITDRLKFKNLPTLQIMTSFLPPESCYTTFTKQTTHLRSEQKVSQKYPASVEGLCKVTWKREWTWGVVKNWARFYNLSQVLNHTRGTISFPGST